MMRRARAVRRAVGSGVLAFGALLASTGALAAGTPEIGYVDQAALATLPAFSSANAKLTTEKAALDAQFTAQMRAATGAADQTRIAQTFQQRLLDRQRELLGPLLERAQNAIATVAVREHLGIVLDKQIVIVGGENITKAVSRELAAPQAIAAPSATPGPSSVGYVDQTQLDRSAPLQAANDAFAKFQADREAEARRKLEHVRGEAARAAVLRTYEATVIAERRRAVDPIVKRTRATIATTAAAKGLSLVVDRASLVYGGTDITSDVANALK